jgi:alcohol dehydrogenase class IV
VFETAGRIIFGLGAIRNLGFQAAQIVRRGRVLIVTDKGVYDSGIVNEVRGLLRAAEFKVNVFDGVDIEPSSKNAQECGFEAKKCDLVIGVGGGSALDVAKIGAIIGKSGGDVRDYFGQNKVLERGLPTILIPTTSGSGSEVSPSSILSDSEDNHRKRGIRDLHLYPSLSIVDPELTLTLPPKYTAYSGIDALAHAVGAYISKYSNPVTDMFALKAVKLVSNSLIKAYTNGNDNKARYNMSLASTCAMLARTTGGPSGTESARSLVHGMAHPLGSKYGLAHGITVGLMLPYVYDFNNYSASERAKGLGQAFNINIDGLDSEIVVHKTIYKIQDLIKKLNMPTRLRDIGLRRKHIKELVSEVLCYNHPHMLANWREVSQSDIIDIYEKAL